MTYPLPCATSPFNWPALNRYSYEDISAICAVSADFIYFVDRGEIVGGDEVYIRERVELVNFTLAELAAGRRPQTIRNKLFNKWMRACEAREREQRESESRAIRKQLDDLKKHGRKMGWLPPAEKRPKRPAFTEADAKELIEHLRSTGFLSRYNEWARIHGLPLWEPKQ